MKVDIKFKGLLINLLVIPAIELSPVKLVKLPTDLHNPQLDEAWRN